MSKILKVVGASWVQTKISSYILGILGVLAILALFVGQIERKQEDGNYAATVFHSNKTGYRIEYWGQSNKLDDIPKGVARAYFRMDMDTTGWSVLEVETDASYPDEIQAYAAGIVEGALTWSLIHSHLENTIRTKCETKPLVKQCNKLRDALDKSVNIWKSYATEKADEDPFWHHVSLYYTQINGIFTGWKHGVERSTSEYETDISDLYWLNSVAEVYEIQHKLNISLQNSTHDVLPGLSSAFVRIVNETGPRDSKQLKLFMAHNAAGSYSSMTRILKRYKLNYHLTSTSSELAPGSSVDFSGYPGSVTSQDEFYLIKGDAHRIAVTGTTLRNYNKKIWKDVNITEQIPMGPRITAANHLATNVSSWTHSLACSNSGTASKQWLVVDFSRLHQHDTASSSTEYYARTDIVTETSVKDDIKHTVVYRDSNGKVKGLLWLLEQVPGRSHAADLSDMLLNNQFFATLGIPFFDDIKNITHYNKMEELYGHIFSETESPRAVMFRQGYKNVTSVTSLINLMRQNNITAINRVSGDTPACAEDLECMVKERGYWSVLGVRGDIVNQHKEAYGVIDTKVISGTLHHSQTEFVALSGPTYTKCSHNITKINKGNIVSVYTDKFDDEPMIDGLEIRDMIKQQQEEAEQETLEILNRDVIKPFQWSQSDYENHTRVNLPDKWEFNTFKPNWSW